MQIMVDIETFGARPDARILQISAIAFDFGSVREPHELLQAEDRWFDAVLGPYNDDTGFEFDWDCVDRSTLDWWGRPEQKEAMDRLKAAPKVTELQGLTAFAKFVKAALGKRACIWAKPPTFDLMILRGNLQKFGIEPTWHWRQERDMRTLLWLADKAGSVKVPDDQGTGLLRHYGLHDAARQAVQAQAAFRALHLHADRAMLSRIEPACGAAS